ncbi:MAG: hypothetical protein U5R31_15700 [Acidimicrobiia bacterium]|nr:hypothetical protein [Acidimicrobiia bacterium]
MPITAPALAAASVRPASDREVQAAAEQRLLHDRQALQRDQRRQPDHHRLEVVEPVEGGPRAGEQDGGPRQEQRSRKHHPEPAVRAGRR